MPVVRPIALVSFLCCAAWIVAAPAEGGSTLPADLAITPVAGGFTSPVAIRHAGDGSGRLFVVEQGGTIRILEESGTVLPTPFLDISAIVLSGGEQGLLGLAFHPAYPTNGHFYVNYTRAGDPDQTVVARYTVSAGDPDVANPASAVEILVVDQPFTNHNGGDLHFHPTDGFLYVGMGDGGDWATAQDPTSLLGKMLRIDVDGGSPYAIPPDNPFAGDDGIRDEIWALGLRNPWRWSFDRATGDLLLGDVGEGDREEIDHAPSGTGGLNFGWPCLEGTLEFQPSFCDEEDVLTPPIFELDRNDTGACSIIGGYVYRGTTIPEIAGRLFFSDWCTGESFFARQTSPGVWDVEQWDDLFTFSTVGYGEDEAGEIHLNQWDGISRLVCPGCPDLFADGFESGDTSAW